MKTFREFREQLNEERGEESWRAAYEAARKKHAASRAPTELELLKAKAEIPTKNTRRGYMDPKPDSKGLYKGEKRPPTREDIKGEEGK